jgi:predicted NBD/HSP70 family sugar kinase
MNFSLTGYYNITRVLRQIWLKPGISRIELSERLELNKSTITKIIGDLQDFNLVIPIAIGDSSPQGGRKKICLDFNKSAGHSLGLELTPEYIKAVFLDLVGNLLWEKTFEIPAEDSSPVDAVRQIYPELIKGCAGAGRLIGVGVAVPGIVDPQKGVILRSNPLGIDKNMDLGRSLKDIFHVPCFLDNDANCCCYGELMGLEKPEDNNFIYVLGQWRKGVSKSAYKGTSIGMGLVVGASVHYGKDYSAGEFRSIIWKNGNQSQFSIADKDIAEAGNDRKAFIGMTRELASNTALLVNVFDMNTLYLGGFFGPDDEEVREVFASEIKKNRTYPEASNCEVKFSVHGTRAVVHGAAALVLDKIFGAGAATILNEESGAALLLKKR